MKRVESVEKTLIYTKKEDYVANIRAIVISQGVWLSKEICLTRTYIWLKITPTQRLIPGKPKDEWAKWVCEEGVSGCEGGVRGVLWGVRGVWGGRRGSYSDQLTFILISGVMMTMTHCIDPVAHNVTKTLSDYKSKF